jgi:hypothetical protein
MASLQLVYVIEERDERIEKRERNKKILAEGICGTVADGKT